MTAGSACPDCAECQTQGTLRQDEPQVLVKLVGSPLVTGTRYQIEITRCDVCGTRFKAPVPDEIKTAPKYDVSVATTLAIARYSLGLPMHRIEQAQAYHGIPLPDATQWDLLQGLYQIVRPVVEVLQTQAADGDLMLYDDTPNRILAHQAQHITTHTTAFISVHEDHKIHLFFTGKNHAGKNAGEVLDNRTKTSPVIAMMDAAPCNRPQMSSELEARFILCFCLVHGRRKFFEVSNDFDTDCDFVLDIIGQVYSHDAHCKKEAYSPEKRLLYHQAHSQPLMDSLYVWLNNKRTYALCERNAGLGDAINYMLRHRNPLTTFLRVAGAPLDSSWAERAIKIAIRHRRASLFYKTPRGAQVGDTLMSLIYTCTQNGINPYDYLNALQRDASSVKATPEDWLPWNYLQTIETLDARQAA